MEQKGDRASDCCSLHDRELSNTPSYGCAAANSTVEPDLADGIQ
ncbi:hypothetical protein ACKFKG_06475 [Phormidesmis sp. 146-35]